LPETKDTRPVPSAATIYAVRKLGEFELTSESEARSIARRLWPNADPSNLDVIISLCNAQRRPVAKPKDAPVIVTKIA
jgi:hypothetical protein